MVDSMTIIAAMDAAKSLREEVEIARRLLFGEDEREMPVRVCDADKEACVHQCRDRLEHHVVVKVR